MVSTMSAPACEIGEMDVADRVGLRQHQQIVIAAQIARPVGEALAAEIRFGELALLDHRAHGAVEHEDFFATVSALACWAAAVAVKSCFSVDARTAGMLLVRIGRLHAMRAKALPPVSAMRPHAEKMADRIDEIGAVHRVEMEIAPRPRSSRSKTCSAATAAAIRRRVVGSSSRPSKRSRQPVRHAGAGPFGEIGGLLEILHRHDARHDRDGRCPRRARLSRKRK